MNKVYTNAPSIFIIEGIDNTGKGNLLNEINNQIGFYQTIKFSGPKKCSSLGDDLQKYQRASFTNAFSMIQTLLGPLSRTPRLIFDRFHLGELVYSPLYRGYSGDYVFDIEKQFLKNIGIVKLAEIRLVLLVATDPSKLPDDGKSFDVSKAGNEQSMFIDGFNRSIIKNKVIVNVQDENGNFRKSSDIFQEAVYNHIR